MNSWKLIERKMVFSSRFVNVYEDKVELPNGKVLEDYTIVEKPSVVMVVVTDTENNILILREYKHGAGKILFTLPAGHKKESESVIDAAKREVKEEIGATGGLFEELGILYDYPSKDIHKITVVRARAVTLTTVPQHEETETIRFEAIPIAKLKEQIHNKEWHSSSALAALTLSGILF